MSVRKMDATARRLSPAAGVLLAGLALALAGCAGAVIGAGAATVTAASEERGLGGATRDLRIKTAINGLWIDSNVEIFRKLSTTVYEGRVLLTGNVETEAQRVEAVRLAWTVDGVREVINEIHVGPGVGLVNSARDSWITTQLKSRLTFDSEIASINYSIETSGGVIYLMGVAQDAAELRRVEAHARDIAYVRRVVSYVLLKDDPRRKPKPAA